MDQSPAGQKSAKAPRDGAFWLQRKPGEQRHPQYICKATSPAIGRKPVRQGRQFVSRVAFAFQTAIQALSKFRLPFWIIPLGTLAQIVGQLKAILQSKSDNSLFQFRNAHDCILRLLPKALQVVFSTKPTIQVASKRNQCFLTALKSMAYK
jgi:hypothetical protein